jgi:hypothetical protein
MVHKSPTAGWIRAGLIALPVYGLIMTITTVKPQPDQVTDPEGWARFVSSTAYLIEHLASNVLGTVLVVFGTFALGALLVSSRAPRLSLWGMVLSVVSYLLFTVPGVISTFATPPIGAAYLGGNRDVMKLEFSPVLSLIIVLALLLAVVGNTILAVAIWRSGILPKWSGVLWGVGSVVFYLLGAALGMATTGASLPTQPVGAALLAIAGAWISWAVLRRSRAATKPSEEPAVASSPPG